MATNIVEALCHTLPAEYRTIAVSAAEAAPIAGREILRSVASARPELRPLLNHELAKYARGTLSVPFILDRAQMAQAKTLTSEAQQTARPLTLDATPFGNPNGGHPNNGNNGLHGGRNYAKP
jgi:hypothetical protein